MTECVKPDCRGLMNSHTEKAPKFGENEPAKRVYQVRRGAVRSYKLLSMVGVKSAHFILVGDIFGLENGAKHRFTAEAIVKTTACLMKRESLQVVAETDAVFSRNLRSMTASNLEHAENHILLLGRKNAVERVAAFLLEMDGRTGAMNVSLPMSRRDIADYLGLTLETVSARFRHCAARAFSNLSGKTQREIFILDRQKASEL